MQSNTNLLEPEMKVTTKGQVTIPVAIRERLGLHPDTEVEFTIEGDAALIRKARSAKTAKGRGARTVAHLWGRATVAMTTDEIMALTRGE